MEGTIGEIRGFAGNFAPRTWAFCQGQIIPISSNTALFSILGTIYGGDGRTSFALPDLRGRVMIGAGTGPGLTPRREGQRSGLERETISILQLPSHTHTAAINGVSGSVSLNANSGNGDQDSATDHYPASVANSRASWASYSATKNTTMAADAAELTLSGGTVTVDLTGGSQPINVMQPYLAIYWIICLQGVFPSRN